MKKQKKKIILTIEDNKVTLTMEGGVPNSIAQSIPDFITSALKEAGQSTTTISNNTLTLKEADSWTLREKVRYLVLRYCRHGWFTSKDVKELYDRTFHPDVALATVCTYLSRMNNEGSLTRRGSMAQREYRVNVEELTDEITRVLATNV